MAVVTVAWLLSGRPCWGGSLPRFPAGFVTSGTDDSGCWSWPWGSASPSVPEPRAWQRLLFEACLAARQASSPDPALIQGVCKKPGSYKFGLS